MSLTTVWVLRTNAAALGVAVFGGLLCGMFIGVAPLLVAFQSWEAACDSRAPTAASCLAAAGCSIVVDAPWCPTGACCTSLWPVQPNASALPTVGSSTVGSSTVVSTTAFSVMPQLGVVLPLASTTGGEGATCREAISAKECASDWYSNRGCLWDGGEGFCRSNDQGQWSLLETGVVSGALIAGATIGSAAAHKLVVRFSPLRAVYATSLLAALATALLSVCYGVVPVAKNAIAVAAGRVVCGMPIGLAHVVCPMVALNAIASATARQHRAQQLAGEPCGRLPNVKPLPGAAFQVSMVSGIALIATVGCAMGAAVPAPPLRTPSTFSARAQVSLWLPSVCAIGLALSAGFLIRKMRREVSLLGGGVVGGTGHSHSASLLCGDEVEEQGAIHCQHQGDETPDPSSGSGSTELPTAAAGGAVAAWKPFAAGLFLAVAQQLTGINAIVLYAPQIMSEVVPELKPLTNSALVMWWNALLSVASLPLSRRFHMRKSYLLGLTVAASVEVLCGIVTYPGVVKDTTTRSILGALCISVFIAFFGVCMGPLFWVLATELYPESMRSLGSSVTNTAQLSLAMMLIVVFPTLLNAFSNLGEHSPARGLAGAMFCFAGMGFLSLAVLSRLLHPAARRAEPTGDDGADDQGPHH